MFFTIGLLMFVVIGVIVMKIHEAIKKRNYERLGRKKEESSSGNSDT